MKKIIVLAYLLFILTPMFAQTIISHKANAILPDASILAYEFDYINPGKAGANQIWDFSKIKLSSNIQSTLVSSSFSENPEDFGVYNLTISEKGIDYHYDINENSMELKGCSSADISLVYTDPLIKMKYPFAFGEKFTDEFSGHALYKKLTTIVFNGDYSATADGYGTLVLPNRVVKNALRVSIHKKSIEINPCSSIKSDQTSYFWYAEGYRYPIITLTNKIEDNGSDELVITKIGYYNPLQINASNDYIAGAAELQNSDFALNSYPNPFVETLNYSYFLRKPTVVSIELFDISGKSTVFILKNQSQATGIYTGEIDANSLGLVRGVYYLKFTYDQKVIVHKIVKV